MPPKNADEEKTLKEVSSYFILDFPSYETPGICSFGKKDVAWPLSLAEPESS